MSAGTRVRVSAAGSSTIVAAVLGELDAEAGRVTRELVATALAQGADRVEIDLRSVRSFTTDGVSDLAALNDLSPEDRPRIVFVADDRAGRAVLLAIQGLAVRS